VSLGRLHTTLLTAVALGALLFPSLLRADSLERMEEIASRFPTLRAFLADSSALAQYREALKKYMNQDGSFDPVYAEFIRQIFILDATIPGFGDKAWRVNPHWRREAFTIEAEKTVSGLEIRRAAVFRAINRIKAEVKSAAKETTPQSFESSAKRLIRRYQLPSRQEFIRLPQRQLRTLFGNLDSQGFAQNRAVKKLTNFLAYAVLVHDEPLQDALFSGDADLMLEALRKLKRPGNFEATLSALGLSTDLLPFLELSNRELESLLASYSDGLRDVQDFRSLPEVTAPGELLAELAALHAEEIEESEWRNLLTRKAKEQLREWKQASGAALKAKRQALARYRKANPYFTFETFFDKQRRTIRLTVDAKGRTIRYVPTPRPFHVFFGGRKSKECISGRERTNISPKRFARAALEGSRSWFTELADQKMEGLIGVTALEALEPGGNTARLHALDFASRASKSRVIVTDARGRATYFIFDILVDKLSDQGVDNLVLGDGLEVAANITADGVIEQSAAYREGRNLGSPSNFRPIDRMADSICSRFPQILHDYGSGGMVYAGSHSDGNRLIRLTPRSERGRVTRGDLEREIYSRIIQGHSISDSDSVWKVARENSLVMESAQAYRRKAKNAGQEWLAAARALLNAGDTADDALYALQRAVLANTGRADLVAPDLLSRAVAFLAKGDWESRSAADYLAAVYQANPDHPGLLQKEVLLALEPMLDEFNEHHRPMHIQTDMLAALMLYQSMDSELFLWLQKVLQREFGGALREALARAFIKAFKSEGPRGAPVYLLGRIVESEEFEKDSGFNFDWVLSVALAGENADLARSAEVLSAIFKNRPGTKAARIAAKMVSMYADKLFPDPRFITPELVAGLTQSLAHFDAKTSQADYTAGTAASAIAALMRLHPTLSRLVTPELLAALYLGVTERKSERGDSCNYVLSEIFSSHTGMLKASHRQLYDFYLNNPENREALEGQIFGAPEILTVVLASNPPRFVVAEVKRRAATPGCPDWILSEAAKR
jgi:hypothetical protein